MRRLVVALVAFVLGSTALALYFVTAGSSANPARRTVAYGAGNLAAAGSVTRMPGLRPAGSDGPCAGVGFEIVDRGRILGCTHGPESVPPGASGKATVAAFRASTAVASGSTVPCVTDGVSGNRVQAVYAHVTGKTDRFTSIAPLIKTWAGQVNQTFNASAAETLGSRQVRWVTTSCVLNVKHVTVPSNAGPDFGKLIASLDSQGLNKTSRKYLVWTDTGTGPSPYCGLGQKFLDSSPGQTNRNNRGPGYASAEPDCWDSLTDLTVVGPASTSAHELNHALGAVQGDAPKHSAFGHCTDEWEAMCYVDGPGTKPAFACPITRSGFMDCHHDTYFSTKPKAGSYLKTHWNVANNRFLLPDAPPSNDKFTNADPVAASVGQYIGSNRLATKQTSEPSLGGVTQSHSIWYRLTAPSADQLTVDTHGSGFNTVLGIYKGTTLGGLQLVVSNDDAHGGQTYSLATATLESGKTYYVKVDGKAGAVGPVVLHVGFGGPPPLITGITPTSGPKGTTLTITGTDLLTPSGDIVLVDGFQIISFSEFTTTEIKGTIPSSVNDPSSTAVNVGATGPVMVVNSIGVAFSDANFKVTS